MIGRPVSEPKFSRPADWVLPADLQALRDETLALHGLPKGFIPELTLADAEAWVLHTDDEPWQIWKARRFAARLEAMPIVLSPGELLVGKPRLVAEAPATLAGPLDKAREALTTVPPFPGGDNGHFHPDYQKLLRVGVGGLLKEIGDLSSKPGLSQSEKTFYESCRMVMLAFSAFIERVGQQCREMASEDRTRSATWIQLSNVCAGIAVDAPGTFHEAIQLMHLILLVSWEGEDHGQACYGRLDQHLFPFYQSDRAAGRIDPQRAFELISALYILQNRLHWPGGAVAVIVSGVDADGNDRTNDLSYLCLAARLATKLVYPTLAIAWHEGVPRELMDFSASMLATGIGDPAFFNDKVISEGLQAHGVSAEDSHDFMNSTCVEIKVAGASNIWVANPYINCPAALLEVMAEEAHVPGGSDLDFAHLAESAKQRLAAKIREAAERNEIAWQGRTRTGLQPWASCVIQDCLARGRDFDDGGARYHWVENSWVGLANLVDSLIAVKAIVYDERRMSLSEFYRILEKNFEGEEPLRQEILNRLPKYGNDDPAADGLANEIAGFLMDTTESNTVGGHRYVPGFFCWVMHERLGRDTIATPDGRRASMALADGAGPAQGREHEGPTAAILSTTSWDHRRALGGLVHNAKFTRTFLDNQANHAAVLAMIETYLRRGGFEIQINVVSDANLRDAQKHPDQYRDLIVRIAGYSDYFVHLAPQMQEELIQRTAFNHA